jgi:hypothetical protein
MVVLESTLIENYPRLYHMAHQGGWPAIRDNGLMSATALLDAYGVRGKQREAFEFERRPECVRLDKDGLPGAVLRDQKPMADAPLAKCLRDGLEPREWYEILNARSFFWLSRERVWRLLKAKAYRDVTQTVLTVDTASLVSAHRRRIRLSPINSGSTLFNAQPRGRSTFMSVEDFPFNERAKRRTLANNVVELAVDHSVPDIFKHVLAVHEVKGNQIVRAIWRSPAATRDDHP